MGLTFFSFLMGSINSIVESEQKLQDIIDERIEDLETSGSPDDIAEAVQDFLHTSLSTLAEAYGLERVTDNMNNLAVSSPKLKHVDSEGV